MKKVFALAAMLVLASVSMAQAAGAPTKQIELGLSGGVAVPTDAGVDLGFGGQVYGLYRADEKLGFGAGVGFHTFSITGVSGASDSDIEIQALLKAGLGDSATKPYILVGAGLDIISTSITLPIIGTVSGSTSDPMVSGGLGIQFPAGDSLNIFIQGQADIIFGTGATSIYIPAELGLNFDI